MNLYFDLILIYNLLNKNIYIINILLNKTINETINNLVENNMKYN